MRFTLDVEMGLHCLSRAELISLKLPQFNLNRDLWSFLSRSLLHIFLPVSLLLHPLLSRFSVFVSHFCAVSCGAPRPLSLALVPTFPLFLWLSSRPSNPLLEAFRCVFSFSPFQASSFNYEDCFSSATYM